MPQEVVISEEVANEGFSVDDIINMPRKEVDKPEEPETGASGEAENQKPSEEVETSNVSIEMKKDIVIEPEEGNDEDGNRDQVEDGKEKNENSVSIDDLIKEKTGGKFSKWEDVQAALSKEPGVSPELQFDNDFSKQLYENIRSGNIDEVVQKLSLQQRLKDIDNMDDEDVVKLSMRLKHPGWDKNDVEDEYESSFDGLNSEDNVEARAARRKFKDTLAEAKKHLSDLKSDIKLREIKSDPVITPEMKEQQEAFSKNVSALRERYLNSLDKTKDGFKGFEFNVEDDDIKLKTFFNIDEKGLKNHVEGLKDFDLDKFFESNYMSVGEDGKSENYDTDRLTRDLWMIQRDDKGVPNYQKLIVSQLKQVLTEAKRAVIGSIKGRDAHAAISHPSDLNKTTQDKDIDAYLEATSL